MSQTQKVMLNGTYIRVDSCCRYLENSPSNWTKCNSDDGASSAKLINKQAGCTFYYLLLAWA